MRGPVIETAMVTGTLTARNEVLVGPEIEGLRIVELLAEEGDAEEDDDPRHGHVRHEHHARHEGGAEADAGENPKGGTGFGVRLLVDWILSIS